MTVPPSTTKSNGRMLPLISFKRPLALVSYLTNKPVYITLTVSKVNKAMSNLNAPSGRIF